MKLGVTRLSIFKNPSAELSPGTESTTKEKSPRKLEIDTSNNNNSSSNNSSNNSGNNNTTEELDPNLIFSNYRFPFEDVFDHPECRKQFKLHLTEMSNEENIVFYEICEEYKRMRSERNRFYIASHLIKTFIETKSEFELNLPQSIRQECLQEFYENSKINHCSESLFDKVIKSVFLQLKIDAYPRWNYSSEFKKFVISQLKKEKNLLELIAVKVKNLNNPTTEAELDPSSFFKPHWLGDLEKMSLNKQKNANSGNNVSKVKEFIHKLERKISTTQSPPDLENLVMFDHQVEADEVSSDVDDDSTYYSGYENGENIWETWREEQMNTDVVPVNQVIAGKIMEDKQKVVELDGALVNELEVANVFDPMIHHNDFERVLESLKTLDGWEKFDVGRSEITAYTGKKKARIMAQEKYGCIRRFRYSATLPISTHKAAEYSCILENAVKIDPSLIAPPKFLTMLKEIDREQQIDMEEEDIATVIGTPRWVALNDGNTHASFITHHTHKYPWPIKERSFLTAQSVTCEDAESELNHKYIIYTKSINIDNAISVSEEKLRALMVQGIILEPIESGKKCKLTVVSWFDMKNKFSLSTFNKVMKKQALSFIDQLCNLASVTTTAARPKSLVLNTKPSLYDTLEYYLLVRQLSNKEFVQEKIQSMTKRLEVLLTLDIDPYRAASATLQSA